MSDHDPGAPAAAREGAWAADAGSQPNPSRGGGAIRLGYYPSQVPLVEVDATYYALPTQKLTSLWVERTPPDLTFDIKVHALMTGQPTETKRLPKVLRDALPEDVRAKPRLYAKDLPPELMDVVWAGFADALEPLREAGQLGSILLQYPKWFFPISESRDAILEARDRLAPLLVAVELRNGTWFNEKNAERTLRFLDDHDLPFVMVDEPQGFKTSVPLIDAVTSDELAIVRFHGRNAQTWEAKGITPAERFRYLYDREELAEWAPRIGAAASRAKDTHVLMNNCYANYGAVNAREIAKLLEDLSAAG